MLDFSSSVHPHSKVVAELHTKVGANSDILGIFKEYLYSYLKISSH